jgi:hypothetical protein
MILSHPVLGRGIPLAPKQLPLSTTSINSISKQIQKEASHKTHIAGFHNIKCLEQTNL